MKLRLAIFLFLIVACNKALPCTCMGPLEAKSMREVAEWYQHQPDVGLIFEGEVVKQELRNGSIGGPSTAMSMTGAGRYREVSFDEVQILRGTKADHLSVLTGLGTGDCGYPFQTGERYLVFASKGPNGSWFTSICSGTNTIEDSGAALRLLRNEKPNSDDLLSPREYEKQYIETILPKRTGTICGRVLKPDGSPLKGAGVQLWEVRSDDLPPRGAEDPNTTLQDGHFCIEHAEPGAYLLTAESEYVGDARYMGFYPGVFSQPEATRVEIKPGVRSPDVTFHTFLEPLYTIRIRVVSSDGTQLSWKNGCGVSVDSVYRDPLSYHISHTLEDDGSYTFGYIPIGNYIVSTFFEPDFDGDRPKPFPESAKWKSAQKEVVVKGDTDVVIQMEPASPK